MAALELYALGRPRICFGETPLSFPSHKAQDLLFCLALAAGQAQKRDRLAEQLWPQQAPGKGRRSLATALWRVGKTLEAFGAQRHAYLRADRDTVVFDAQASYHFDVESFERCAAIGLGRSLPLDEAGRDALEQAGRLYRGDFLEGCYDDWCLVERERLQLFLLRVLKRLQQHCRLTEDYGQAILYGQRLIAIDPLQEDVHRELMRCYAAMGQRAAALRQFQHCRETLRRDLQVEPQEETWRLYQQIRRIEASIPLAEGDWSGIREAIADFRQALDRLESAWHTLSAVAALLPEEGFPR